MYLGSSPTPAAIERGLMSAGIRCHSIVYRSSWILRNSIWVNAICKCNLCAIISNLSKIILRYTL